MHQIEDRTEWFAECIKEAKEYQEMRRLRNKAIVKIIVYSIGITILTLIIINHAKV